MNKAGIVKLIIIESILYVIPAILFGIIVSYPSLVGINNYVNSVAGKKLFFNRVLKF